MPWSYLRSLEANVTKMVRLDPMSHLFKHMVEGNAYHKDGWGFLSPLPTLITEPSGHQICVFQYVGWNDAGPSTYFHDIDANCVIAQARGAEFMINYSPCGGLASGTASAGGGSEKEDEGFLHFFVEPRLLYTIQWHQAIETEEQLHALWRKIKKVSAGWCYRRKVCFSEYRQLAI